MTIYSPYAPLLQPASLPFKIVSRAALLAGAAAISVMAASSAIAQTAVPTAAGASAPVSVQSEPAEQEIVVTGSRISNPALSSPIPVTAVTAKDLLRTGNVNIGDTLARLPALSSSQTQAGSLAGGNTIGLVGANILDLRSLGSSRTLVLVNGQRHITSYEGEFLVDVNTIPTDLVDRVDIVTGGSSAVYGSDAMAGVVNFILKQNFEGLTFNAQGGTTSRGDRGTYRLSGTYGKNFGEGRGNIAVSLEYNQADALSYLDRPSLTGAYAGRRQFQLVDNSGDAPERQFLTGIHSFGYSNGGTFIPYIGSSTRACNGVASACLPNGFPRVFLFQPDGSLSEANYGVDFRPVGSGNNQGGSGATLNDTGTLDPGYKRYVANVIGHYDVSDAFKPYFEAKYVRTKSWYDGGPTFSQGGPQGPGETPLGLGYYIYAPIQLDNAFLTPQARDVITSLSPAGTTYFNLNRNNVDLGGRGEIDQRDTFRIVVGAKGTITDGLNYHVAVNYGHLKTKYTFTNNRIEENFYNAIDAVYNGAGQIVCRVNQVAVTNPACQPLNILGTGGSQQSATERQAALAYINTTSHRWGHATELDINADIDGDTGRFFNLPGGPISFSIGGEYRRETASYHYDDLVTSGATFLNAIAPFNPPSFAVKEAFAEVGVPIAKDVRFIRELSLRGAARVSDYKGSVGTVWAYNLAGIYSPIRDITFRVNFSHSVRAPTLGDLYTTASQNYASVDDPCDPNFVNSGSPTRAANCTAAGVPAGYQAPQTRAGTLEILTGGNPQLKAETSRSWTYGVVLQPRFIPGLTATIDYYDIKIKRVISPVEAQTIVNGCYDAPSLNNAFCELIYPRNPDGTFQLPALLQSSLNFSAERAKGIDVDVAYNRRIGVDNNLALRFIGSWVKFREDYPYIDNPSQPQVVKGTLGSPVYQFIASADFTRKNWTLGYQLRYVGRQAVVDWEYQHQVDGVEGTPYDPLYTNHVYFPRVIYHDLRFNVDVKPGFSLYGGVDNFTNKKPPYGLLGNGASNLTGSGNDQIYDNIGRFMYVGVRIKI